MKYNEETLFGKPISPRNKTALVAMAIAAYLITHNAECSGGALLFLAIVWLSFED